MTQRQFGALLHVSRAAVTSWEVGARSSPSVSHLMEIARISGVSFEWLATGHGNPLLHISDNVVPFGEIAKDKEERRLLKAYRNSSERVRREILEVIELTTHAN